jgi:hypothetical protein
MRTWDLFFQQSFDLTKLFSKYKSSHMHVVIGDVPKLNLGRYNIVQAALGTQQVTRILLLSCFLFLDLKRTFLRIALKRPSGRIALITNLRIQKSITQIFIRFSPSLDPAL